VALIEIRDVSRVYDLGEVKVEALIRASLAIEKGEYVALIGPSGSGKSTLMNTLGCLDRPTSGSYKLAGEEVATMSREERAHIRNPRVAMLGDHLGGSFGADMSELTRILWPWLKIANPVFRGVI
jgi:putative ABC transport system ATP-binding protein